MADANSRSGTVYHGPGVLDWVARLHAPHDPSLRRAYDTPSEMGFPQIQVSPSEGKLLGLLMGLIRAERAVEVGTLAGYSTIWLARGLAPGGHLWSVEYDPSRAGAARSNLEDAGLADRADVLEGPALDVLPSLVPMGPFDAVFVDADKENYPSYGRWAAENLRPGGLLLADNAFYFGGLLGDTPGAEAVRRFHEEARQAFDTAVIPTPDGLLLGIRR